MYTVCVAGESSQCIILVVDAVSTNSGLVSSFFFGYAVLYVAHMAKVEGVAGEKRPANKVLRPESSEGHDEVVSNCSSVVFAKFW